MNNSTPTLDPRNVYSCKYNVKPHVHTNIHIHDSHLLDIRVFTDGRNAAVDPRWGRVILPSPTLAPPTQEESGNQTIGMEVCKQLPAARWAVATSFADGLGEFPAKEFATRQQLYTLSLHRHCAGAQAHTAHAKRSP